MKIKRRIRTPNKQAQALLQQRILQRQEIRQLMEKQRKRQQSLFGSLTLNKTGVNERLKRIKNKIRSKRAKAAKA